MKSEKDVLERLGNYRNNLEQAKKGKVNGAQIYINAAITELEWVLEINRRKEEKGR